MKNLKITALFFLISFNLKGQQIGKKVVWGFGIGVNFNKLDIPEKFGVSQLERGFNLNLELFKKISLNTTLNSGIRLEFDKLNLSSNARDSTFDFTNLSVPLNFIFTPFKNNRTGFIIGSGLTLNKVQTFSPILDKSTTNLNYYITGGCFYDIEFKTVLLRPVINYERTLSHSIRGVAAYKEIYRLGIIII